MGERSVSGQFRHEMVGDAVRASPLAAFFAAMANGMDWPTIAAMLAALYTVVLLLEKLWKGVIRPMFRKPAPFAGRWPEDG